MNFDELQKSWREQSVPDPAAVNTDLLLQEVRRNHHAFMRKIFLRDVRETLVAWILTVIFAWLGWRHHDWMQYLIAFACFGIGLATLADLLIQRRRQPLPDDSLKVCTVKSLRQVNHQIWLLRNIFWWYLLPLLIPLLMSNVADLLRSRDTGAALVTAWAVTIFINFIVFGGVYWINQYAVRHSLEPRRQELEKILMDLE